MSKAIPRGDLPHTVTHKVVTGVDMYGTATVTTEILSRVRLEPTKRTMLSDLGEGKDDKYLMFWDARNSTPATFSKLDKIVFDGVELTIREAFSAYDKRKLHHLEIYLT